MPELHKISSVPSLRWIVKRIPALLGSLCLALAPSLASAHFLWATFDSQTKMVGVGLLERPGEDPLPLGEMANRVRPSSKSLTLKPDGNWMRGSVKDNAVGVSLDYGVLDRREEGRGLFWLCYYAKAAKDAAAAQKKIGLPVELILGKTKDGRRNVTALSAGKPAPMADIAVELAGGKPPVEGKTGPDGTFVLPASTGPIAIRVLVTDPARGTREGKAYDLARSYSTLTVGSFALKSGAQPLTAQIRAAFGDDHDIVGRTAFIETLMAGKLTRPQLEDHLQQRALIHELLDRVLSGPPANQPVPYQDEQRQVLSLLRQDMKSMGTAWPAESVSWPLTKGILNDIRESAKKSPYFALGVFHVYYGGITHGGRDIGAMINTTLKIDLTYYRKSDGYAAYARKIDEITDPEAQKEVIRGGVAAYRYIIAVNDTEVFRSR